MSYKFEGSNDRITTTTVPVAIADYNSGGAGITMMCWFLRNDYTVGGAYNMVNLGQSSVSALQSLQLMTFTGGDINARVNDTTNRNSQTDSVTLDDQWHMALGTYKYNDRVAYYDGEATNTLLGNFATTSISLGTEFGRVVLGINPDEATADALLSLAHVAIWDIELTQTDIDSLAAGANPLTIQPTYLKGYWALTDDLTDTLGGGNTLTNSGATYNSANPTVDPPTVKKLKFTTHPDAASVSSVAGVVFNAPTGGNLTGATRYGEFTGKTFEASTEGSGTSKRAVLKVPVADFGGTALTTSDSPVAVVRTSTIASGVVTCTVIEE